MFLDGRKLPPLAGTVFLHFHLGPKTVCLRQYVVIQGEFIREIQLFAKQLSGGVAFKNQKMQQIGGFGPFGFCIPD